MMRSPAGREPARDAAAVPPVEEQAPAKVNLDLRVTGRRSDGYHKLDSIVAFAACADRLTFAPDRQLTLELTGPFAAALAGQSDNLVLRAARRLADHAGCPAHVRIALDKRLPVAAGLGGGSADAAATLRGLSRLWQLELSVSDLLPLALELGADVPVCLRSRPARMRGIGERIGPVELPALDLVLANPNCAVSTAQVFAGLGTIAPACAPDQPIPTERADLLAWLRARGNDLEAPARRLAPAIGEVIETLGAQPGCRFARMSGSGGTCFGVFDDAPAAARAAHSMRRARPGWWVVGTATRAA
jgi:4-diphosphocytidyl-2-C-methyl-D-erythritol kinase